MKTKIAYSSNPDINNAVAEIKKELSGENARFIIYFASSNYNHAELAGVMTSSFDNAQTMGCTTAGELVSGKMLKNSVVAMGFGSELIEDFEIVALRDLNDSKNIQSSFAKVENKFNKKLSQLEYDKYFGIVLIDGLSGAEENLMNILGDLTDIIFVGGSAGDDLKFKETFVFDGNEAFKNGAVIAIVKSKVKFGFIKTQSFKITGKTLLPTKVDEKTREVLEFNNKPAVEYYSVLLNVGKDEVEKHFMKHPVGLVINEEPYVRSPQRILGNSMKFYCSIKDGVQLNLLESTDIIKDTRDAIKKYEKENGAISALVNFNCILRTLELEDRGLCEQYGEIFKSIPTIGFSTYGEEYIGHVNQTATMLALG